MEGLFVARHGESELSVKGVVNGEPVPPYGLTRRGEDQARELGTRIAGEAIALVVTSDFERCRLTAAIAMTGRDVPRLELPELGDIRAGVFEGGDVASYLGWAHTTSAHELAPGGGESRTAAARRFASGFRALLGRPEPSALVVSHQVAIRYLLLAAQGATPRAKVEPVPYATLFRLSARELRRAAETLDAWAARPDW